MYIKCIGYRDAMYDSLLLGHDTRFLKTLYKPQACPLQSLMKFPAGSPLTREKYGNLREIENYKRQSSYSPHN